MKLNKLTVALLAIGVSGAATAGGYVPAPCLGEEVVMPCEEQGFKVGVDFIYVQSTGANVEQIGGSLGLPGSAPFFTPLLGAGPSFNGVGDNLDWAPGVAVEGAYLFGNGNDVTGRFSWWQKKTQNNGYNVNFSENTGIFVGGELKNASADGFIAVDDQFWDLDLEFGTRAYYGEAVTMRYHVGLKYVDISRKHQQSGNVSGTREHWFLDDFPVFDTDVSHSQQREIKSTFRGFGPRAGVDGYYEIMDSGFSLVGKAAVSLLVGDTKTTASMNGLYERHREGSDWWFLPDPVDISIPYGDQLSVSNRTRQIIPGAELSLGGEYTFDLPEIGGDLGIEAGYQWANYSDAIQHSLVDYSSFGYHGIYLGLIWSGDAASDGMYYR